MESWLNKKQGLSPRGDKSRDRDQYEDSNNEITHSEENNCPECFYTSPLHSPQCSQNQTAPRPTNWSKPGRELDVTNDSQTAAKFDSLKGILESAQDLKTLETSYQIVKADPFYQGESRNKKMLDNSY